MKIAIRGGHSLDIRGAHGVVDEVTEDRKIYAKVKDYLILLGHSVLDVTPTNSGSSAVDLSVPIQKATAWGADYFVSIHLNATPGGYGSEVLYKSEKGHEYANRIVAKLSSLGFHNRGAKQDVRGLYEFNHCPMVNNIVETFFCDSQGDVDIYNKVGIDAIAKAIAEGITNQCVSNSTVNNKVLAYQKAVNAMGITDKNGHKLVEDGVLGALTLFTLDKIPLLKVGSKNPLVGWVQSVVKCTQDCDFGNITKAYVVDYQKVHGLVVDGIIGKITAGCMLKN